MKKEITLFAFLLVFNISLTFAQPGKLDSSFSTDGKVTTGFGGYENGASVAIQSNGKIIVAGTTDVNGNNDFAITRYNSDGTRNTSFGTAGKVITDIGGQDYGQSIAIQPDGKIIVAGWTYTGFDFDFALVRYTGNGVRDNSFGNEGIVTTGFGGADIGLAVAIQIDGKIVVAGYTEKGDDPANFAVARYNSNGSLDNTFSGDGKATVNFGGHDIGNAVAINSNGKIIIAGYSDAGSAVNFAVARLNSNGAADNTFGGDGKVVTDFGGEDFGNSVAIQSNGKIVVAGYSDDGSDEDFATARYNNDGNLDHTFSIDGIETTGFGHVDEAYSVAIQTNGKIVVAGESDDGSDVDFAVLRYNSDGTLDNTFAGGDGKLTTPFGHRDMGRSVAIQSNGRIVVAGSTLSDTDEDFAVARYIGDKISLAVTTENISSVNDKVLSSLATVKLFPNPAKNILSIQGMDASIEKTISIVDINGRIIQTTTIAGSTYTWNIQTLPAGTYYLLIDDKKKTTHVKFVKE